MVLTLECLLNDTTSNYFKEFSAYLHQQYSTENLMFWLAVEQYKADYRQVHVQGHDKALPSRLVQQCLIIIYTHIQPNSCREINIPCDMRLAILDSVLKGHQYHPDLFIPAAEAVLELMRANAFIPWLSQWAPSLLPTLPPCSPLARSSAMVTSLSSPDGWNTVSPASSPRPSVSSFRSTNDAFSANTFPKQRGQHQQHIHHSSQRRGNGLRYQSMLKKMKDSFFNATSITSKPLRRSSLTWSPATNSNRKN